MNPSINDCGNGQGWLPTYRMSVTCRPTSSAASRATAASADSPGSTKPARIEHDPVAAVVDQHDHGRVGAREDLGAGRRVPLHPSVPLDGGGGPGEGAEPIALVPLDDADGLDEQARIEIGQVRADLPESGPGVDRPSVDSECALATDGGVRDAVRRTQVDGTQRKLGLLVPDQRRTGRSLDHRNRPLTVDGEHPHRAPTRRVRQRARQVPAVVGDPGQHRHDPVGVTGARRPGGLGHLPLGRGRVVRRGAAARRHAHAVS
jgi:hypothetical protein